MDLRKHYKGLYEKYGDTTPAVHFADAKSQCKRFEILSEITAHLSSVIDMGCGLAHLYPYLQEEKQFTGRYLGLDFTPEFIQANQVKYANDPQVNFLEFDLQKDSIPDGYDFILLSGVFNNTMDDNKTFMLEGIAKMYYACNKGIAFNAMSTYVDFQADDLYYSDPLEVFDFCKKNLTRKVTLRHDYLVKEDSIPFEYAMYLYK